jgi:hypothetical protein
MYRIYEEPHNFYCLLNTFKWNQVDEIEGACNTDGRDKKCV